ncbi:Hg(II)-responsive transcriptional regulator [Virgibacillus sp. DJP39]|uniref:Hg(II)-responsive transcriptional regulator n=1 Tax=Virgibacillus sp. DJP39 TaxID=3409790 RepID=UPI003BB6EF2A
MSYHIGELAEKCEVNKETIRYYERKHLIHEPPRTNSGYRIYEEDTVKRIHFIKRMQTFGFSLQEIDKLLGVVDKDDARCADMYEFVSGKLIEVEQQMNDLERISLMLKDLKERCPNEKELHACPIIETIINE